MKQNGIGEISQSFLTRRLTKKICVGNTEQAWFLKRILTETKTCQKTTTLNPTVKIHWFNLWKEQECHLIAAVVFFWSLSSEKRSKSDQTIRRSMGKIYVSDWFRHSLKTVAKFYILSRHNFDPTFATHHMFLTTSDEMRKRTCKESVFAMRVSKRNIVL